ncbi:GspE/PulE family protein [Treponema sp. OttesenSCG-928-L16]|nr:GspE/PulE family protein [Treponema sp. OttesenSCG-928-L16]
MEGVNLRDAAFSFGGGSQYSRDFMIHRGAVKLSETDDEVHVAFVEGSGQELVNFIAGFHIPKRLVPYAVSKADFAAFIGETSAEESAAEAGPSLPGGRDHFSLDTIASGAPLINIINSVCIEAIRLGASDIHIEASGAVLKVRYRIDGVLRTVRRMDPSLFQGISNRIKIMADMNTMESRLPQDGRMTVAVGDVPADLRVSVIPVSGGESIVLRLFAKSNERIALGHLGFDEGDLERLRAAVRRPYGLILLTGPTGSGKTTTLHALLSTLPADELKIITIEDPVEQLIPGISQVQIHDEINLSFDGMLRRVLRQDPNVIMVGEIRDTLTAELAMRSALTGHLILSTLHTNDSVSVIPRLTNMGIEPYIIAAVLRCSAAQRLVRKLCPLCAKESPMDKRTRSLCKQYGVPEGTEKKARGCESCGHTGYKGRTLIGEVLMVDTLVEDMIARGSPAGEILSYARGQGMRTMAEDGLMKVASGLSSMAELERELVF